MCWLFVMVLDGCWLLQKAEAPQPCELAAGAVAHLSLDDGQWHQRRIGAAPSRPLGNGHGHAQSPELPGVERGYVSALAVAHQSEHEGVYLLPHKNVFLYGYLQKNTLSPLTEGCLVRRPFTTTDADRSGPQARCPVEYNHLLYYIGTHGPCVPTSRVNHPP